MFLPFWWGQFPFPRRDGFSRFSLPPTKTRRFPNRCRIFPTFQGANVWGLALEVGRCHVGSSSPLEGNDKKIFELLPKILNQKVSKKQIPTRIKSNKPVLLHVLPPKNKTHHSNPPNPFNPQSTQAAEDGGRPVASGFAEGQRLAVLEQLGELSLKPLSRCIDIMEDCVFVSDLFTVDVSLYISGSFYS